eukprot:XP_008657830.1 vegetative cell wall protein gp1-like [Zea mays]
MVLGAHAPQGRRPCFHSPPAAQDVAPPPRTMLRCLGSCAADFCPLLRCLRRAVGAVLRAAAASSVARRRPASRRPSPSQSAQRLHSTSTPPFPARTLSTVRAFSALWTGWLPYCRVGVQASRRCLAGARAVQIRPLSQQATPPLQPPACASFSAFLCALLPLPAAALGLCPPPPAPSPLRPPLAPSHVPPPPHCAGHLLTARADAQQRLTLLPSPVVGVVHSPCQSPLSVLPRLLPSSAASRSPLVVHRLLAPPCRPALASSATRPSSSRGHAPPRARPSSSATCHPRLLGHAPVVLAPPRAAARAPVLLGHAPPSPPRPRARPPRPCAALAPQPRPLGCTPSPPQPHATTRRPRPLGALRRAPSPV